MEGSRFIFNRASEFIRRADHMFYMTYPLVRDNKLIITMAENICNGMNYAIDALLMHEREYKRISPYPDEFGIKLDIFRKIAARYDINKESVNMIIDLKMFLEERKNSKMEFIKNDKYMLFNQKQELKSLGIDKLKQNLNISKEFIKRIGDIIANA